MRGVNTGILGEDSESDLAAGRFQIVFSSPEMLFMRKQWRDMLTSDIFTSRL